MTGGQLPPDPGSPGSGDLSAQARTLLRRTLEAYADRPRTVAWLRHHLDRFDEPLRLALAGKVKAGKSTLLNALVGEEVAATDAGECTRVITWYADGPTPRVTLYPRAGAPRPLPVRSGPDGHGLALDLGGAAPETVDRLGVDWPSAGLRTTTLIDTPGIASLTEDAAGRAAAFLGTSGPEHDAPAPADAVLYLMRHLHAADARFLESFHDRDVARATPVNTVAVLSRADEIGAGRPDAMESARRIADRYRGDEKLAQFCQTVVAVAGLLALTGRTLRTCECTALSALAATAPEDTDALTISADRFVSPPDSLADRLPGGLDPTVRAALLDRLGLFGVRTAVTSIRRAGRPTADPARLAADLLAASGLGELRDVLDTQFTERRDVLKTRSALLAVDAVLRAEPRPAARGLAAETERIVAGAHEFAELRLLSGLRSGAVTLPAAHRGEAERLVGGAGARVTIRLGLERDADDDRCREAVTDALGRWRRRAASPVADRVTVEAAGVVVRSCEGMLADLSRARRPPRR